MKRYMKQPTGKLWVDTFFARKTAHKYPKQDLTGKTVIFTGGMGRLAVERFAQMGADICLIGRSLQKTMDIINEMQLTGYKGKFHAIQCDLGDLTQVRGAAGDVSQRYGKIDFLINCAGVNLATRSLSPDGYEVNFSVNYLAPFLLTELLLDRIKATPNGRILHLASATQEVAKLHLDDLNLEQNPWSMLASYAQAKLCVIIHGHDLAERLEGSDVTINSLNPGYIRSNLTRHVKGFERVFTSLFGRLAAPTWVGAERIVAAALDPRYQAASGAYIYEDMLLSPNPIALDGEKRAQLMQISREMTQLDVKGCQG
ncbi:SDR family NAD(P)-dependent oxidoreductase [Thalassobius sp. I31.1]|uniref:SDR family NAD(P)-dependent oxidoreductase n=1 Tax=Thalassobius sp. I31.1 TaxID=2109912 RepID=UPI000D1BC2C7|nr:SDR family NAD(P)-dependent oxidoreductase [Thalassobius sp. I31.1]